MLHYSALRSSCLTFFFQQGKKRLLLNSSAVTAIGGRRCLGRSAYILFTGGGEFEDQRELRVAVLLPGFFLVLVLLGCL